MKKNTIKSLAAVLATSLGVSGCAATNIDTNGDIAENSVNVERTVDENLEYANDEFSGVYQEIDIIKADLITFLNDAISKGLIEEDLKESDLEDLVKDYLNYYLIQNADELSGYVFDVLNQNKNMNESLILRSALVRDLELANQAVTATPDTLLKYHKFIKDKNDVEVVKEAATIVANLHIAIEEKDAKKLEELTKEAVEFKDNMIKGTYDNLDPMTIDLLLLLLDDMDALTNGMVISDDEAAILNQVINLCLEGDYVTNLSLEELKAVAVKLGVNVENLTKEEIILEIQKLVEVKSDVMSKRSVVRVFAEAIMQDIFDNISYDNKYNKAYSYKEVVDYIVSRIDLTKFKKPEKTANEIINDAYAYYASLYTVVGEPVTHTEVHEYTTTETTTTTQTVTPDEVPEEDRVEPEVTYKDDKGNETTKEEIEEKKKDIEEGSKAGAEAAAKGDYEKSNTGDKGYDEEYNDAVEQAKEVREKAIEENKHAEEEAVIVEIKPEERVEEVVSVEEVKCEEPVVVEETITDVHEEPVSAAAEAEEIVENVSYIPENAMFIDKTKLLRFLIQSREVLTNTNTNGFMDESTLETAKTIKL